MENTSKITFLDKLKREVIPGINLFEAVLFTITTIIGVILFFVALFPMADDSVNEIVSNVLALIDIPLGVLAATFLSKKNKLAPLLLAIDAILYGSVNFLSGNVALGTVNAIITPILYALAYFWIWPKEAIVEGESEVKTRKFDLKIGLLVVFGVILISVIFGWLLPLILPNAFSSDLAGNRNLQIFSRWFDAFAATLMLFAVIASIFRFRETWFLYLCSNVMKLILFTATVASGYPGDTMLLLFASAYLINAIFGVVVWNQSEVYKINRKTTN